MIIDLILNRKDGDDYSANKFYHDLLEYDAIFDGIATDILRALDSGTERDVKAALCDYITRNEYNPAICEYVNSVNWLPEELTPKYTIKSISEEGTYFLVNGWRKHRKLWISKDEVKKDFNKAMSMFFDSAAQAKASLTKLLKVMPEYATDEFEIVVF